MLGWDVFLVAEEKGKIGEALIWRDLIRNDRTTSPKWR